MDNENPTTNQLAANAAEYDRAHNEGGEGYNPYTAELERREIEAETSRPITRDERRSQILGELERLDCSIARESGTYDADKVAALRAELNSIDAEEEAEFAAEWTAEVTKMRRAEWNARVRAGEFADNARAVQAAFDAQGWTVSGLKRAVAMNRRGTR